MGTLVYPTTFKWVGIFGFIVFLGFAIVALVSDHPTATKGVAAFFGSLCVLSLGFFCYVIFIFHKVSAEGLDYGRLFSRRIQVAWFEISSVRYVPFGKCFKLKSRAGVKFRIDNALIGIQEFAQFVLDHVPSKSIDVTALEVLRKTASGDLPPV